MRRPVVLTVLLLGSTALASGVEGWPDTPTTKGDTLLTWCEEAVDRDRSAATFGAGFCVGFVQGFLDLARITTALSPGVTFFCDRAEGSAAELTRVVVRYLREHPEIHDWR